MNCSPPGSSVHGILQARILKWVALPSSRGSSQPRDPVRISHVSRIGSQVLYHEGHLGSPFSIVTTVKVKVNRDCEALTVGRNREEFPTKGSWWVPFKVLRDWWVIHTTGTWGSERLKNLLQGSQQERGGAGTCNPGLSLTLSLSAALGSFSWHRSPTDSPPRWKDLCDQQTLQNQVSPPPAPEIPAQGLWSCFCPSLRYGWSRRAPQRGRDEPKTLARMPL